MAALRLQGSLFLWFAPRSIRPMPDRCAVLLMILLALASCGPTQIDAGPGGVSVEDAKALDEAAVKLDRDASATADQSQ